MGRFATQPEVIDTEYAFVISRVLNPDDEFNERQVLCRDDTFNDCFWGDYGQAYGPNIIEFQRRHEAELFLRGIQFGIKEGSIEEARRWLY